MKLDYSTTETRFIDEYNKSRELLEKQAKANETAEYDRLRQNIHNPFEVDFGYGSNFAKDLVAEIKFNSQRRKAKKQAHKKYTETIASFDPKQTMLRDKAYAVIQNELYEYGYSMAYLNRLPEKIVLDLYRAYLLDKETGFQMPIEMKLEGHMNAILSNIDIDITASNFFKKAQDYTSTGRSNAYYAPARQEIDKHFVCHSDEAFKYSVACRQARFDFFESIDHRKMAEHTPVTQSGSYKKNLSKLIDSGLYDHNNVERKGKNPYARLLTLKELETKLMYEEIASTKSVKPVSSKPCDYMGEFYKAYVKYLNNPSSESRREVMSRVASATALAEEKNLRCSVIGDCIDEVKRAHISM